MLKAKQIRIVGLVAFLIAALPTIAQGQSRLPLGPADLHGIWWEATPHNTVVQIDLQPAGGLSEITYHRSGQRVQVAIGSYLLHDGELTLLNENLPQQVLEQHSISIGGRSSVAIVAIGSSGPYVVRFAQAGQQLVLTDASGASRVWTRYPPPHFGLPVTGYHHSKPNQQAFPWLPSGRIDDDFGRSQPAATKPSPTVTVGIAGSPANSRIARSVPQSLTGAESAENKTVQQASHEAPNPSSSIYRSIDGSGNNPAHPDWGSAFQSLIRNVPSDYADGLAAPAGANRASPRAISNIVAVQPEPIPNDRQLSDFVWQWGQFLDHDISLTEVASPQERFDIVVPAGDPTFDPTGSGRQTIALNRSRYDATTGVDRPREQINQNTAYIDASNVYGSDPKRAAFLRSFYGGRLKTSGGDLLPYNDGSQPNDGGMGTNLFVAGDVRANEQVALIAMHTLFVREHNRLADEIASTRYRGIDLADAAIDEAIYQQARRIVGAQMQAITYNEFLPALLGRQALGPYRGYNHNVNAGIANVFSTAGFRAGHSMISPQLLRLDNHGIPIAAGPLTLRNAFFRPDLIISEGGIEPLLKGLASQRMQQIDIQVVDGLRNSLLRPPATGGFDLVSLNIQRGRDHGLASYNATRTAYGLAPVRTFAQITSNPHMARLLASAYRTVDDVDVWVGALAEDHLRHSSVGPLTYAILVEQFQRLRSGDRYWYENTLSPAEIHSVNHTKLADIIRRNTRITKLQDNVFFAVPESYRQFAAHRFDR